MKLHALLVLLAVSAPSYLLGQNALLSTNEMMALYGRSIQLMDSTTAAVPGLARAAAPIIENARQTLDTIRRTNRPQDGALHYGFLNQTRAFLALADAMPKPHPFPAEAAKQFVELRAALDRADVHFRALLALKEQQLRNPDRDNLKRYADANATTSPPVDGTTRVVFLGDSITDGWRLNEYFPGKDYLNRGISGQTTGQMLGRFIADVAAHKPAVMVLLGGTNDIARGVSVDAIRNNITMIADLAEANKIRPVLASILPIHDYNKQQNPSFERSPQRPPETIRALNTWMASFCRQRGYVYLDYFTPTVDERGFLKQELADDGLHPNSAGYRVMAPLVEASIAEAIPPPPPEPKRRRRGIFGRQ
ncbi:MAG: SGNH/GDSL hydrolase family protein [Bryobacteraceae bacterium]